MNENRPGPSGGHSECSGCLGDLKMPNKHLRRAVRHRKTAKLGSNDVELWGYLGNRGSRPGNLETRCQADNEIEKMTLN